MIELLLAAAIASQPAEQTYRLAVPTALPVGTTYSVERREEFRSRATLSDGQGGKPSEDNKEHKTTVLRYRETVLERPEGKTMPTSLRRHYDRAEVKVGEQVETLALAGKTVLIEKKGRAYRFRLEGGQEVKDKGAELLRQEFEDGKGAGLDFSELLPAKAVRVGESWQISPKLVRKGFGKEATLVKETGSKGTGKLLRVHGNGGRRRGMVEIRLEAPLAELTSTPAGKKEPREKLQLRPGARITLHLTADLPIDGKAGDSTNKVVLKMQGTALVPAEEGAALELTLTVEATTEVTVREAKEGPR